MIDNELPLVTILCITFNHGKYLADAIEGFLMQKTNFSIEIIIHDDASTDNTAEIIYAYQSRFPELIKGIIQTENHYSKKDGSLENAFFSPCRGKYIAFCEGDDYWTDPSKLQKQFDFLESNHDYGLVHHDADYLFQKTGEIIKNHQKSNGMAISTGFVYEELLQSNNIYSPTVMFRADLLEFFNSIDVKARSRFLMGDYIMWLEFSQHLKFHYIPESMAVYRVLEQSASKSEDYEKMQAFVNSYFDIRLFFISRYPLKNITTDTIENWRLSMNISTAIKFKKNGEARKFASQLSVYDWRSLLKRFTVYFPGIFRYIQKKNKL
jgi:glycosyltransferase involved in cell wall biosynthesis